MIPKIIHFIWVGDESKRPDNCIQTWVHHNPEWLIKIWGNDSLTENQWINAHHMREMSRRELNGVADMMRWEILYKEGGFVVDADSVCLRALDDNLLEHEAFACWESEIARPGLIAAGYFACGAGNPFVGQIVKDIYAEPSVVNDMAWKTVGPTRLTESFRRYAYHGLSILPSHLFIPEHFTGIRYQGPGPVYAHQEWASTKRTYDTLHLKQFGPDGSSMVERPSTTPASNRSAAAVQHLAEAADPDEGRATSPLEARHDDYFIQRVQVGTELAGRSRIDVFAQLCAGKRVLHIGCADWPITDPKTSLHVALDRHCEYLDGFDIHGEALAALAPYSKGKLFSRMEDLTDMYDLVLAPEVMEHVPDVAGFLSELNSLKASHFVLTVPDAYQCHRNHFDYVKDGELFVEVVHPDHNCWYSPFTLTNVIRKYTPWQIDGVWFFNRMSLLVIATKPMVN